MRHPIIKQILSEVTDTEKAEVKAEVNKMLVEGIIDDLNQLVKDMEIELAELQSLTDPVSYAKRKEKLRTILAVQKIILTYQTTKK